MTRSKTDRDKSALLGRKKDEAFEIWGIDASKGELLGMIKDVIERFPKTWGRADPSAEMPETDVEALERGGFTLTKKRLGKDDPLAMAAAEYAALVETGLTTNEAAAQLGVDPSRIRQRLAELPPTLYGIRMGSEWRLPRFQFEGRRLVPKFEEIVGELRPDLHPVAFFRWFTTPNGDLLPDDGRSEPLSPRDWLLAGYPAAAVAEIAELL